MPTRRHPSWDGTAAWAPTPPAQRASRTLVALSAGDAPHLRALKPDNTALCWGADGAGQASPPEGTYIALSAGGSHTCAIGSDDTVACRGFQPIRSYGESKPSTGTFVAISAGLDHTCAIRTGGTIALLGGHPASRPAARTHSQQLASVATRHAPSRLTPRSCAGARRERTDCAYLGIGVRIQTPLPQTKPKLEKEDVPCFL